LDCYRYDDRFTGTWVNEVFCDSSDIEEVMEDIIQKRLNTCSTYAGVNDLTVVPEGVPIFKEDIVMKNTIFRVCNQFGCIYDVIVGEVVFKRYIVDLREYGDLGYLKGGSCHDFVGFNMKRVLISVDDEDRDSFIERHKDLIERMTRKGSNEDSGKYFIDYLEEVESPEYHESYRTELINDSIRLIQKFKNVTATTDEYASHIYCESTGNKYIQIHFFNLSVIPLVNHFKTSICCFRKIVPCNSFIIHYFLDMNGYFSIVIDSNDGF